MTDTPAANNNDPAPSAAEAAPAAPPVDVQASAKELAELKDKLLRALADMENLRRRTERDIAEARAYAIAGFAEDLIGAVDNMRRAVEAARGSAAQLDGAAKAVVEGVELTERELLKALEKHGVRRFDPLRERFDPNLHQALFEVADADAPPGTVAQVVQPGYMIGDRVLRPARVAVSKSSPRSNRAEPAGDAASSSER
jgi:molecular chaperone GrpE